MMKRTRPHSHRLKNNRGFLSVDFLFAMTMAAALCMMMFAFSTTLTMIEIAQYIAYSTARAHAAGHTEQARQTELGKMKFETFTNAKLSPNLSPLLKNGWFEIDQKSLDIRGGGQTTAGGTSATFNDEYGYENESLPQIGVRFRFRATILKMNIPFMGALTEDDDFGTWVTGFMFREPTTEECTKTLQAGVRYKAIKRLDKNSRFQNAITSVDSSPGDTPYFPMEDNGC